MPNFTAKEERQEKHVEESEKEAGKSPKKAKQIGFATVEKAKKLKVHKVHAPKAKGAGAQKDFFDELFG